MSREADALHQIAALLMPAEPGRHGIVLQADERWNATPIKRVGNADIVVWGRTALPSGTRPRQALRAAAARERALRLLPRRAPGRLVVTGVHRLSPPTLRVGGLTPRLRAALFGGALVELTTADGCPRVLDAVAQAAGGSGGVSWFRPGSGGLALAGIRLEGGLPAIVRGCQLGSPVDPRRTAGSLEALGSAGIGLVPRLLAQGVTAGASWTVESALAGRRPPRVGAGLVAQLARFCAGLPRAGGPPTALDSDLQAVASALPERAARVGRLAADLESRTALLPAIARHGDLWAGNLLVDGELLTGVIDWDAWHPAALPGADLVQLLGTERRIGARWSLGEAWLRQPWTTAGAGASADYWRCIDLVPDRDVLETAGIAWWATEVSQTLRRLPHRAFDERWVATNVDPVLGALGL